MADLEINPALAFTVEAAAKAATVGRTSIYEAINSGALKARKIGRRTIILEEDLRRWLSTLPSVGEAA